MGRAVLASGELGRHNGLPATIIVVQVMRYWCYSTACRRLAEQRANNVHNHRMLARDAVEIVALDIFNRAGGEPVDMTMVRKRIEQLRAHRPACHCGLCDAAQRVRPDRVWRQASAWQRAAASRAPQTR
jgi:hypothetical protein